VQLGDIVRLHGEALRRAHVLTPQQHAALRAIERCRTAALGGHLDVCLQCGHAEPAYNSCRNRHCPKCQALAQARWVAARSARILPTHYFHVVFTLPAELRALARANPHELFDMVFAAASETLLELGRDSRWLGAQLGVTAVLHTWTRELVFHPHVHCIVTGGGLTDDGSAWRSARKNFLLPVHVMGALFRGKTISKIRRAQQRGRLELGSSSPQQLRDTLDRLQAIDWIVYAKRPFGGALQVVRYLGRYTHRAGISNQRLVSLEDDKVTFRTKDGKTITLPAVEMLARFVQHVLPPGFVRIRHFGLMAPANVTGRLDRARQVLMARRDASDCAAPAPASVERLDWRQLLACLTGIDLGRCAACGAMAVVRRPLPELARAPPHAA
jgi:hypothetical protein